MYISREKLCTTSGRKSATARVRAQEFFTVSHNRCDTEPFQRKKRSTSADESGWAASATWWPRRRSPATRSATIRSIPPYVRGGTGSSGSAVTRTLIDFHTQSAAHRAEECALFHVPIEAFLPELPGTRPGRALLLRVGKKSIEADR